MSDNAVPTLTVTGGPLDGRTLSLIPGTERLLGSAADASLSLNLQNVSDRHARVLNDPERGVLIADLGSVAGTFVNGEKLDAERALAIGDRVCLGPPGSKASVKLLLVTAPVAEEPLIVLDGAGEAPVTVSDEPAIILDDPGEVSAPAAAPPPPPPPLPAKAPVAAAPPAPAPAPAKAAPATPPAAPAPAAAKEPEAPRKAARPDYSDEPPSIVPTMQRQPLPVPPAPPVDLKERLAAKKKGGIAVPRVAIAAAGAVLLLGAGYFALRSFIQGPPVVLGVVPPRVEGGQTVTVSGSSFGSDAAAVTVRVGGGTGKIVSVSETQIAVQVPDLDPENGAAEFPLTVETRKGPSNPLPLTITAPPRILAIQPDVAMPGDEVVATGKHLKGKPLSVSVDGQAAEVLEATGDRMRFRIPALPVAPGRAAPVQARVGREQSKPVSLYLGRLPLLIEAAPVRASAGERVTLRGRGFAPSPEANQVRFGAEPALVLQASESEIVVAAPGSGVIATQIDAPVLVENASGRSNAAPFQLQRLSSGVFLPRYFAVPVPDHAGMAFVSTEIGPLFVLGGRGEAASLAARAVAVAAALNGVMGEALKKAVAVEARDASVAVAGGAVIAVVTSEDVAAYAAFDPGARRATPRAVATLWAALVQEQLDLFARRQRPGRLLEVTPRGRAMMQLYSEALRRGGAGAGVPLSVVNPLPSGLARDLREMALYVPAEGQGSAAAAMEGRWQGTMWEEGSGEKRIVVRLRLQGGRLAGSLTASAGAITGDIPLQDAAYAKGVLRFAVMVGGARHQFEGQVNGEKVSGSISRPGSPAAIGRFALSYAE